MKYISFLLFCLSALYLPAQVLTVSEDIPLRSDATYDLIGELKGQTLLFRDRGHAFDIQAFDERMQESWTKDIELDKRSPKVIGITTDVRQENFWLIYHFRQKGHTILKVHQYDAGANLVDSTVIADLGFLFFTPRFEMAKSADQTKTLLYYAEQNQTMRCYAFDLPAMKTLYDKSISPDDFYYTQHFLQMIVDNEGGLHLVLDRDNFRSRRKQHYYEVHSYGGRLGDQLASYNLGMGDRLTYDVYFEYDNKNKRLAGAGLFSERELNRANGYFFIRVDPGAHQNALIHFENFDDEFITSLTGKKPKRGRGIAEASVRQIIMRQDGGALIVAERNRQLERRSGATSRIFYDNVARLMVDYYYDELFILGVYPDGKLHWTSILHKKQYSQDDEGIYSSFFLLESPTQLRFLFNDEISFENTVSEYVLNGLGEYDRNSIFSTENMELRLRFRDAIQIAADELLIPSERRNRLKIVKLAF